jgi:hypothetical protein
LRELVLESRAGVCASISFTDNVIAMEPIFHRVVVGQCSVCLTGLTWCEANHSRLDARLAVAIVCATAHMGPLRAIALSTNASACTNDGVRASCRGCFIVSSHLVVDGR